MREDWSTVSEETLAALFPILLELHHPEWKAFYLQEKEFLQSIFGDKIIRISHIGSTAVAGLIAKPTVDILLETSKDTDLSQMTETLLDQGYVINAAPNDIITYIKGYTPSGFKGQAAHIHVRHLGDWGELYFRDYLILHSDVAKEYAKLKLHLQQQYRYDRDGYTEAKGAFVQKYTQAARREFRDKYKPATI